jgi:hypothetical protein
MDADAEFLLNSSCSPSCWIEEYLCTAFDPRDMTNALTAYLAKGGKLTDGEEVLRPSVHNIFRLAEVCVHGANASANDTPTLPLRTTQGTDHGLH